MEMRNPIPLYKNIRAQKGMQKTALFFSPWKVTGGGEAVEISFFNGGFDTLVS